MADSQVMQSAGAQEAQAQLGRLARRAGGGLLLALLAFVLWAAWAPLDEGVPAVAQVAIETQRKSVQHLSGGMVRAIHVKEGQLVTQGQVLFDLDTAQARANLESVRQRYLGLRIMQARLLVEQRGGDLPQWGDEVLAAQGDPWIRAQMDTQLALLRARREALEATLQGLRESWSSQQSAITTARAMRERRLAQQALLREEIEAMRPVVEQGYLPRNGLLALQGRQADLAAQVIELQGRIEQSQRSQAELTQRMNQVKQEQRKDVEGQLASVTMEVQADVDKLRALQDELARSEILSPASGQVVDLDVQTVGAVIQPGQRLLDVVPEGAPLVLDVRIPPHVIDRVYPGLLTDVRFSSFAHSPQLVTEGQVQSVSQDLLTDERQGFSYYLARVVLTPQGMLDLGDRRLQPGMPAEVVIKTGERSMLTYLLHPLLKRIAASLNEE
jgi:protease secretion system membrane fusion protein